MTSIFFFLLSTLVFIISFSDSEAAIVFPLTKNIINSTNHYYSTKIQVGTPSTTINLFLEIGVQLTSFTCDDSGYDSSTYRFINCNTKKCGRFLGPNQLSGGCLQCASPKPWPHCSNQTCALAFGDTGGLSEDFFKLKTTSSSSSNLLQNSPRRLPFACLNSDFTIGFMNRLPLGTKGSLGLGKNPFSFVAELSSAFNLPKKYAFCIPSNTKSTGNVFIGGAPHNLSTNLLRTPLVINPISSVNELVLPDTTSEEYFIGVKSIKIDNKRVVNFDTSLLSINATDGVGGTTLSSSVPYAVLHSSIYKAVVSDFVKKAATRNITRVATVKPFGARLERRIRSTKGVRWTRAGPRVPTIDLELEGKNKSVNWRIHGANSMVGVNKNVICLGFVDGGFEPRTSIVIGGIQLEDNLLEFDLTTSTLGFTSSLLVKDTSCSNSQF
ncbi:hypothetical protein CsatA_024707 [Cannabis sativa]